jgi:hypothetical protein
MSKVPHMTKLPETDHSVGSRTSLKNGSFQNWTVWTTCMPMMSTSQTQVSSVCARALAKALVIQSRSHGLQTCMYQEITGEPLRQVYSIRIMIA